MFTAEAFTELVASMLRVSFSINPNEFRINWAGPLHEAVMHVGKRIYTAVFELDLSTCDNDMFSLIAHEVAGRLNYQHARGEMWFGDGSGYIAVPPPVDDSRPTLTIHDDGESPQGMDSRIQFNTEDPVRVELQRGLATKYIIRKRVPCHCGADRWCKDCKGLGYTEKDVASKAVYFVLRIDEDDPHGEASRVALAAYARMIAATNQHLANDLSQLATDFTPSDGHPLRALAGGNAAKVRYDECAKEYVEEHKAEE